MSYKTKKRWLLLKVQNLKKYYNEILTAFKERLDNVVNPVSVVFCYSITVAHYSSTCCI